MRLVSLTVTPQTAPLTGKQVRFIFDANGVEFWVHSVYNTLTPALAYDLLQGAIEEAEWMSCFPYEKTPTHDNALEVLSPTDHTEEPDHELFY